MTIIDPVKDISGPIS